MHSNYYIAAILNPPDIGNPIVLVHAFILDWNDYRP